MRIFVSHPSLKASAELKKRTLTNLFNTRPTWLDLAHRKLDAADTEIKELCGLYNDFYFLTP